MSDSEKPKSWRERRQSIKHKWHVPFVYVEWRCEQLSKLLEQWAFLDILGHAGRLTILVAVIFYIKGCPERQKQAEDQKKAKHYQAWQVITAAQGQQSSSGRKDALEDLNRDGISLVGVDVSNAHLPELNLAGAVLHDAIFVEAVLYDANFAEADLKGANLAGADLRGANLIGANLCNANLAGADLSYIYFHGDYNDMHIANLSGADLSKADLSEAKLHYTNLSNTTMYDANFVEADLYFANLSGTILSQNQGVFGILGQNTNFTKANLTGAILSNVIGWQDIKKFELANIVGVDQPEYPENMPPDGFIEWAKERGAVSIESKPVWKRLIQKKEQEKTKQK